MPFTIVRLLKCERRHGGRNGEQSVDIPATYTMVHLSTAYVLFKSTQSCH